MAEEQEPVGPRPPNQRDEDDARTRVIPPLPSDPGNDAEDAQPPASEPEGYPAQEAGSAPPPPASGYVEQPAGQEHYQQQPYGEQPYSGQAYGGQPSGGEPYGGQPSGGQTYGGQTYGGQTYGGPPYGQQPYGGASAYPPSPYQQPPSQGGYADAGYGQPPYGAGYGSPGYPPPGYGQQPQSGYGQYGAAGYQQPYPAPPYPSGYGQPQYQQPGQSSQHAQAPQQREDWRGLPEDGGYEPDEDEAVGRQSRGWLWALLTAVAVIAIAVIAILATKPSFLYTKELSASAVASTIEQQSKGRGDFTGVSCPSGEKAKAGTTFTCTAAGGKKITVNVTNDSGDYTWTPSS
jgi:Domain of unknown function (DUF4333)